MRRHVRSWVACLILLNAAGGTAQEDKALKRTMDRDLAALRAAGIATDGPGLVTFFRQRTLSGADETRIKALVRQLGDDEFKLREKASRELVLLGSRARPFLQAATKDSDPEIVRRANDCLERMARDMTGAALSSAVRVLARRHPPQAAEVLLNYLPSAEEERLSRTIQEALASLALRDGKAEPVLVEALSDRLAVKRAAAGAALAAAHPPDVMPRVRKLLDDRVPTVRQRVALALTAAGDKTAVSVLIRQLDQVPWSDAEPIMVLLERLAGDKMPPVVYGPDEEAHRKYREAWEKWWKVQEAKTERAQLEQAARTRHFTTIVLLDRNVIEDLDADGKVRWKIQNVTFPLDLQLLPGEERVLVAEHQANRVSERDLKGEIVWKRTIAGPLTAQRLANGHTFITTRNELVEIDKDGKQVLSYNRSDGSDFMRAVKLRNGDIGCIVQLGPGLARYVRLKPDGDAFKEVKSWGVQVRTSGGRLDVLPNGHVLIPDMDHNRVIEYDADGRSIWEVTLDQPIAATRLANGNTLVTLMRENRAVEVDAAGKEVWQFKSESRVTRALRR